jgi:hypothetical protein
MTTTVSVIPLTDKFSDIAHSMNVQIISPSERPITAACTHWDTDTNCLGYLYNFRNMQIHLKPENLPHYVYAYDVAITHEMAHCIQFNAGFHKKYLPAGPHDSYWLGTVQDLFYTEQQLSQNEIDTLMGLWDLKWKGHNTSDDEYNRKNNIHPDYEYSWYDTPCEIHATLVTMLVNFPQEAIQAAPTLVKLVKTSPMWKDIKKLIDAKSNVF